MIMIMMTMVTLKAHNRTLLQQWCSHCPHHSLWPHLNNGPEDDDNSGEYDDDDDDGYDDDGGGEYDDDHGGDHDE